MTHGSTKQGARQEKKSLNSLKPLFLELKNYKFRVFLVILALITTSLSVLFIGRIIKYLIDSGFDEKNSQNLDFALLTFGICVVILAIAGYFRSALINEVGERIVANLRQKIYRHIILTSCDFFESKKIGDVISRLTTDTTLLYNIISNSISFFLRNLLLFFGGLIFLFFSSVKLTLISFFLIILAVLPVIILGKKVKNMSRKTQEKVADLSSHIEESINGIKTIQAFGKEEIESKYFNKLSQDVLNVSISKIRIRSFLISSVISLAFAFVGMVLWFGSSEVIAGNMSAGTLSSFLFYAVITATSLVSISQVMGQLQTASGAAQRLFELLEVKSLIKEAKNPKKLPKEVKNGQNLQLEFKNVDFSYPEAEKKILQNFDLKIQNQQKIAIIGPSGSGKSTILELMLRFFDVNKGEILINDKINIKDLSLKDLRGLFSYISQESFIFSGTILQNIAFGSEKISKKQVEDLIKKSPAFDFINKMENGVESNIGQKGSKLSGGEKQRIALLRAMCHDAPILILDEATSALDEKNEELIIDLIAKLMPEKMLIVITHRNSTIKNIDRVIKMKDGQIVEDEIR